MANRSSSPKYILAVDCETSGLVSGKVSINPARNDNDPSEQYQAISWGVVVVDFDTLMPVEHFKMDIKFDATKFKWNERAEAVHGLSREYLAANGVDEEEFVCTLAETVLKYWGTTIPVILLGHNPWFDMCFLRAALERHGVSIHFSNRILDTNTLLMILTGLTGSDQMFEYFGLPARGSHDALEDILMTLIAAQGFRDVYRAAITG